MLNLVLVFTWIGMFHLYSGGRFQFNSEKQIRILYHVTFAYQARLMIWFAPVASDGKHCNDFFLITTKCMTIHIDVMTSEICSAGLDAWNFRSKCTVDKPRAALTKGIRRMDGHWLRWNLSIFVTSRTFSSLFKVNHGVSGGCSFGRQPTTSVGSRVRAHIFEPSLASDSIIRR